MATMLFYSSAIGNAEQALHFIDNAIESPSEDSVIGMDLEGKIQLWSEGARHLYGYEPDEVVGKANLAILHVPEDVAAGKPGEILEATLRKGKWEGTLPRLRKNGQRFTAYLILMTGRDSAGRVVGFLLFSKDICDESSQPDRLQTGQTYPRQSMALDIAHAQLMVADLDSLAEHIRCMLSGRVVDFRLQVTDKGLVLKGRARTYFAKQLAQRAVMKTLRLRILANEIDVN
jgi:PAS domain S-box-containing protein